MSWIWACSWIHLGLSIILLQFCHHHRNCIWSLWRRVFTNSIYALFQASSTEKARVDPRTILSIILGGGAGTRLFPLTKQRAKPAVYTFSVISNLALFLVSNSHKVIFNFFVYTLQVPIGGAYRLIDVPMSNCINSGINKVFILTQFNSASLNRHLARTYNFGNGVNFGDGFVEVFYLKF